MEQKGKEMLARELKTTTFQLFGWNIYPDMDIKSKSIDVKKRATKRASTAKYPACTRLQKIENQSTPVIQNKHKQVVHTCSVVCTM